MMYSSFAAATVLLAALTDAPSAAQPVAPPFIDSVRVPAGLSMDPSDIATPKGFPPIGKWMYQDDRKRAEWLGIKWGGKNLVEPVNIVIVDSISRTRAESVQRLIDNFRKAGYADRANHSSGYMGFIGDAFYPQLPGERHHAFSDEIAEINNNHGRVFGPHFSGGRFFYTGAFSRESVDPFSRVMHHFKSFNISRDNLSESLDRAGSYRISGAVKLDNALGGQAADTTGDHDGMAVVLRLIKP